MKSVKQLHIMKMINNLRDMGYAASTIRGVKSLAHNSFQRALDNNYIVSNPVAGIKVSFEDEKKVKSMTIEQQRAFQKSIEGTHYCEMFNLMLNTGIRISEALGLCWHDVDFEKREIKIERCFVTVKKDGKYQHVVSPTKTKSSKRIIPLNDVAILNLKKQKLKMLNDKKGDNLLKDLVFLSKSGTTCSYANIGNLLRSKSKVLKKQGFEIEGLSSHMLRHSFTTRAYENGVNIKAVSQILGHSKIETTYNIYVHLLPQMALDEIDKLKLDGLDVSINEKDR